MRIFMVVILMIVSGVFVTGCASEYEVSLQAEPAEAGSVYGAGAYGPGEKVRIEAEPKEGYVFEKWTRNGEGISLDEIHKFSIGDEGKELVAHFRKLVPCENLEIAIRAEIGKPKGEIQEAMGRIAVLEATNKGISDIRGLEYAVNLERLNLQENQIRNLGVIEELANLKELSLCRGSIEPTAQIDLITKLENLQELEIKGLDRFCGVIDLQLQGSTKIIFRDETYAQDAWGPPEEVELEKAGYAREPVGIFDLQVLRYPELHIYFIRELLPPEFAEKVDEFGFKEVEVFEPGIRGPREIEVGDTLKDVLGNFPVLYQDEENQRRYGRITLEDGSVTKLEFSDYVAENPHDLLFPHHFTFTIYFLDNEVERYHIKHILYDL